MCVCVCVQATHRIHFKAVLTMRHALPLFKHIPILDNIYTFVKQKTGGKTDIEPLKKLKT